MYRPRPPFRRSAWALICGNLVGISLVTTYTILDAWLTDTRPGSEHILGPWDIAPPALLLSFFYAVIITVFCLPMWLLLRRFSLAGPITAAFLGCIVTLVYWVVSNYPPLMSVRSGLPYALCGALAGLATWWVGNRA